MTEKFDAQFELAEVVGQISGARHLAGIVPAVGLRGLPSRIEAICRAIETLPQDEMLAFRPLIETLLGDLDLLSGELDRRRDALARRLASLDQNGA